MQIPRDSDIEGCIFQETQMSKGVHFKGLRYPDIKGCRFRGTQMSKDADSEGLRYRRMQIPRDSDIEGCKFRGTRISGTSKVLIGIGSPIFDKKEIKLEVRLSLRLETLAHMVTPGNRVCDLGCDHCFLPIYLIQKKISPSVIALDARKGPLARGKGHIADYGLELYIDTRISDGLEGLEDGEADTLICAGMGGRLMKRILFAGREMARRFKELILQPQSDVPSFLRFLREEGYGTVSEDMVKEEGQFYPMMKVVPTGEAVPCRESIFDLFGECLLRERNPVLRDYLIFRQGVAEGVLAKLLDSEDGMAARGKERSHSRRAEIEEELSGISRALKRF
jgi:tRNA (adenine22-N1)-methyltransferase